MSAQHRASAEELLELARKYEKLLAWRSEHAERGAIADRADLRALARAFPGALRELDTAPLAVIVARGAALARAAAEGGPGEPWMHWMVAYHALMRAALWLKPRLARGAWRDPARLSELLHAAPPCKIPLDAEFVASVASPPAGRLNGVVFQRLGALFAAEPDAIWEGLFPARRPNRGAALSAVSLATTSRTGRTMICFYGSPASSAGKTHWLLEELAHPYTYVRVSPREPGGTRDPAFRAKNPAGTVPFLEDGDVKLFESMAINLYLAEKYGPALMPADLEGRALVYQWSFWAISNLQPLLLEAMRHAFLLPATDRNPQTLERARAAVPRLLEVLSAALTGRSYLVGDAFGVADINAGAVVNLTASAGVALEPFPGVSAWLSRLRERPAYQKAAASG